MLEGLWARFRRWCHCLWHLMHLRAHCAVDVQDDFELFGGVTKRISCTCGKVFWQREPEVPENWWQYHHCNCGTKFRGCDPDRCPKDIYERTGVWRKDLINGE